MKALVPPWLVQIIWVIVLGAKRIFTLLLKLIAQIVLTTTLPWIVAGILLLLALLSV